MEQEPLIEGDGGDAPQPQPVNAEDIQRQNAAVQAAAYQSWQQLQTTSPTMFYIYLALSFAEMVATAVILGKHWNTPCDRMLNIFIVVFTGRLALAVPLTVYRFANRDDQRNTLTMQFAQNFSQLLSLFVFAWWITGQVWVFGSDTCKATAPALWNYSLVLIIIMYFTLFVGVLIIALLCVCMPCVLVVMRIFAEPRGANKETIDRLPIVKFDKEKAQEASRQDQSIYACAVCMEDYKEQEALLVLPCNHQFHRKCVRTWLQISKTCPTCRTSIAGGVADAPDGSVSFSVV